MGFKFLLMLPLLIGYYFSLYLIKGLKFLGLKLILTLFSFNLKDNFLEIDFEWIFFFARLFQKVRKIFFQV